MGWEYKVRRESLYEIEKILDIEGLEGWELISVIQDSPVLYVFFFKRPKH
jgi:hypothetical protein